MTAPLHEKHLSPRAGKAHSSALQAHLPGPGVLRTYGWFFFHNLNGKADDTFSPGKYRPFPPHTRLAKIRFFSPPAFSERLTSLAPNLDIYIIPDQQTAAYKPKPGKREKFVFSY